MLLKLSTWQEIDAYLKRSKAILAPIGSIEQHGPNGLLGTDALCPEIIAERAMEINGMLVAPTFTVGCAQHHLGFSGTIALRPSTMIAAIVDWTRSLKLHGFERIYWFNGHGGNTATVQAAFSEIYADRSFSLDKGENAPDLRLKLRNWWELPGVMKVCREIYPVGDGMHATASEVAVTYAGYSEAVKRVEMSPKIAPVGEIRDAAQYRRNFPDGRIGSDPSQAKPADGERIIAAAARALAEEFSRFESAE